MFAKIANGTTIGLSRLGYDINNYSELKKEILARAERYPSLYKNTDEFADKY